MLNPQNEDALQDEMTSQAHEEKRAAVLRNGLRAGIRLIASNPTVDSSKNLSERISFPEQRHDRQCSHPHGCEARAVSSCAISNAATTRGAPSDLTRNGFNAHRHGVARNRRGQVDLTVATAEHLRPATRQWAVCSD